MHRSGSQISRGVLCNVADVDLHSYLSLKHGRSCRCPSLVVESEGQWRKHTMLKIRNLKPEKRANESNGQSHESSWLISFFSKGEQCALFSVITLELHSESWDFFPVILTPRSAKIFCALKPITLQMLDLTYAFVSQRGSNVSLQKMHQYVSYRKEGLNQISFNGR